ncbi:MAG: hypothetical protein KC620_25900, partial [Myxococcales bacterium]|nr:hypothetical protein [Myxococcales bacterium]
PATPPADHPQPQRVPDPEPPAQREPDPAPPPAEPAPCRYPAGPHVISDNGVVPPLAWRGAYDGNGQRVDFDLESFHCDPAYARYSVLAVVVGAEWCGACAQYTRQLASQARAIDAAGALLLFIEVEDNGYSPASNEVAQRTIERYAPGAPSVRVGDGMTAQGARTVYNAPIVRSFPSVFAVRRSDMRVIANQDVVGYIDFAALARQESQRAPPPDVDPGVDPGPDIGLGGACDEEPGEPNDAAGQATPLAAGQVVQGGVCNGNADFYRVDHAGLWTLELAFSHAEGDLDVYVWDANSGGPLIGLDGNAVGSDGTSDGERFDFFGQQTVVVLGYQGAMAGYTLRLTGY